MNMLGAPKYTVNTLLHQKEDIDSYKDVICSIRDLRKVVWLPQKWWTYKWKFAKQEYLLSIKGKLFEWHVKWNSFYDARLDSNMARISDEETKMAKKSYA
jgi:hypothetical protein